MVIINEQLQPKLGRLPPDPEKRRLIIEEIPRELPALPISIDNISNIKGPIGMLGNNNVGNCVVAAIAHHFMVTWATLLPNEPMPIITEKNCLDFYWAINTDRVDRGLVTEQALDYLLKNGLGGQKPLAWASVARNWASLESVDAEFVAGIYGVGIYPSESYPSKIWDSTSGVLIGGHEVSGGSYDPSYVHCTTWGYRAKMTRHFVAASLGEHHVIIWPHVWDSLTRDRKIQLAATYKELTGRIFPVTIPPLTEEVTVGMSSLFQDIQPKQRVLDTRKGLGLVGKFAAGTPRMVQITGTVIPATAVDIVGNLTVSQQTAKGYLSVTSANPMGVPTTSDLNFPVGDDRANGGTFPLSTTGSIWITYVAAKGATAEVILDVAGFFAPVI